MVKVCRGTACHVGGADRLIDALSKHLRVPLGGTTADLEFTLESAACLGCCRRSSGATPRSRRWT